MINSGAHSWISAIKEKKNSTVAERIVQVLVLGFGKAGDSDLWCFFGKNGEFWFGRIEAWFQFLGVVGIESCFCQSNLVQEALSGHLQE